MRPTGAIGHSPQALEIRPGQHTGECGAAQRRPATNGETLAGLKKAAAYDKGADAFNRDHRVIWREPPSEKAVESARASS